MHGIVGINRKTKNLGPISDSQAMVPTYIHHNYNRARSFSCDGCFSSRVLSTGAKQKSHTTHSGTRRQTRTQKQQEIVSVASPRVIVFQPGSGAPEDLTKLSFKQQMKNLFPGQKTHESRQTRNRWRCHLFWTAAGEARKSAVQTSSGECVQEW